MTAKEISIEFANALIHGGSTYRELCKMIGEATSYKGRIPKAFWQEAYQDYHLSESFGWYEYPSKSEIKKLRDMIAEAIIEKINDGIKTGVTSYQKSMCSDNYFRLLHALTLLCISKADSRIPQIDFSREDYMYNIAYNLWMLDDGSNDPKLLQGIAWNAAEAFKLNHS